jgi:hypothetical protein
MDALKVIGPELIVIAIIIWLIITRRRRPRPPRIHPIPSGDSFLLNRIRARSEAIRM